jgi:putative aldouronate transport system substrate-binding protein
MKRITGVSIAAAAILSAMTLIDCTGKSGTGTGGTTASGGGGDTSRPVTLVFNTWGGPGVATPDVLKAINDKLKPDLNATLEVSFIDWSDTGTKYPLLFVSGENYDITHASHSFTVSYFTLASQGVLLDITDLVGTATPALKAAIPENTWNSVRYKGRIYGVPTLYSAFNSYGFVYSRNLQEKYGLGPINSIPSMEAYLDAVVKNETYPPINGNSGTAQNLYRMLVDLTGQWIFAPGIPNDQMFLVCTSPQNYRDVIHPAFTQEFEDWAVRMHDWAAKGYWPRDVLSSQLGDGDNFQSANGAGLITHQPNWTGTFYYNKNMPDRITDFWCFAEDNNKIIRMPGVENVTVFNVNTKNPERALMAVEKFMLDKDYYELIQYGIRGRQYDVVNGIAVTPDSYNEDVDNGGIGAAWPWRNDKLNIPYAAEDPRRYTLNAEWDKVAINDPYVSFSFDPSKVSSEISAISNVNSQLGIQIMLGKTTDAPKAAVERYRNQLRQAGIDAVITELKSQLAGFTPL